MSYYVLTLASNLGNILSTESISPVSLYAKRGYGFRFFEKTKEGDNEDLIRLYDEFPTIPKVGESDITMLLELDEVLVRHLEGSPETGLWTAETIRINPARCRFVFYSKDDLDAAFNGVQRSIEAKFADKYRSKAKVWVSKETNGTLFDTLKAQESIKKDTQHEDVTRYERIDRMKGAIFGYCLGFYYSLPKDLAVREDYIEYLGLVDNMVNSVTHANAEELEGYRRSLEYVLFRFGLYGMARKSKPICQLRGGKAEFFDLEGELARLREVSSVELPSGDRNDSFGLNAYRTDLEERIHRAKDEWKSSTRFTNKPSISRGESGPVLQLPEKDGELACSLINYMVRADVLGKTERSLGYPFALECGKAIRKRVGDRWDGSGERKYINGLLPHLNNMEDFDPNKNPGIEDERSFETLRILAMLCERQDNTELDNFYRYLLVKCQLADLCLPFAFWGAAFGFSAMPKTLCDSMSKATEDTARKLFDSVLALLEN